MKLAALQHAVSWTLLVLGLFVVGSWAIRECRGGFEEFTPLEVRQPVVETNPVIRGEEFRVTNGVCNLTDSVIRAEIWLALRPEGESLVGRTTLDLYGTQELGAAEDINPGDCIGDEIIDTAPLSLPLGKWSLIGQVIARGVNPDEVQREPISSNIFEIVEGR